ncbi:MAG TPA: M56 family metallopeptidase, partial [Candidatus Acidoferrum sp.]|nr:M56 family metallopeptidase [Candidatus Acidoferrum sp.]
APAAPAAPAHPKSNPIPWIYAAGAAIVAIRFAAGAVRTRRLLGGSVPVARPGIPRRVRVVESERAAVPLVWGILRPVIVLPVASRLWSAERLHTVLLHELIHVRRRDLLAQVLAQVACCLYWFHPLAWIAAREQRRERERACDDAVLQRGMGAAQYAGHLVELVRALAIEAPAMADAGDFEGRVRALLDRGRNRAPLGRGWALAVSLLAVALIVPMASMTSYAQAPLPAPAVAPIPEAAPAPLAIPAPAAKPRPPAPANRPVEIAMAAVPAPAAPAEEQASAGAIAGIVTDPSGSRIPGASVHLRSSDGSQEQTIAANSAGEFTFAAIPTGTYDLEFRVPGFKIARKQVTVKAGAAARADAWMELGEVGESVTAKGTRPAVTAPRAALPPQRIPIGGSVQASKLIAQPRPIYPEDLQAQGVTGTVLIRAVIGKDGQLVNPRVMNTDVHPGLAKAALESVTKWLYQPTLLNGQPVEVVTSISIAFELDQ